MSDTGTAAGSGDTGDPFRARWLADIAARFRDLKKQAERALEQIDDAAYFAAAGGDDNSPALLVKHLGGNLRSRWTDFLTTDGEKPDRARDEEFVLREGDTRAALAQRWERGWETLFATMAALRPEDLDTTVRVRWEPSTVETAIHRQLAHTAYHVGQIVLLAKHARGAAWSTLSIPRGASEEVNRTMRERFAGAAEGVAPGSAARR